MSVHYGYIVTDHIHILECKGIWEIIESETGKWSGGNGTVLNDLKDPQFLSTRNLPTSQ